MDSEQNKNIELARKKADEIIEAELKKIPPLNPISGFWIRILAFAVDIMLLGFFGRLLGLLFFKQFAELGQWGNLVGFPVALLYFGILNSKIGGGQTIGKKLLRIKVVGKNTDYIRLRASLLRSAILILPAIFPVPFKFSSASFLTALILLLLQISIIYAYIANVYSRQSIHDLICGTYVVKSAAAENFSPKAVPKSFYVFLLIVNICIIAFSACAGSKIYSHPPFKNLIILQDQLYSLGDFVNISTNAGKTWVKNAEFKYVSAEIIQKRKPASDEDEAKKIAKFILNNYPDAKNKDYIRVTLSYGYDIGIARDYKNFDYTYNVRAAGN